MTRVLMALMIVGLVQSQPHFQFDAAARSVRIDQAWELRRGDGAIDVFTSLARCGRDIFLSDTQNQVFRIDAGRPSPPLVRFAADAEGIGRPMALAADCARGRLYVLNTGPRTIVALDRHSGKVLATRSYLRELYEPRAMLVLAPDVLQLGGLWNPNVKRALPSREVATFFDQTSIGARVSLGSGAVDPGFSPYERRCIAAGACTSADVDRISGGGSPGWVASQGISTQIALYDDRGTRLRTIDVRSPKFVRDGTEMPVDTRPSITERWRSRNSVIRRVFAVNQHLVTVHSTTLIGPDWTFGEQPQFNVLMNIHAFDGTPLVGDVRLPDLPIGRDDQSLYAIDYGSAGRGQQTERVRLVRIPVQTGARIAP